MLCFGRRGCRALEKTHHPHFFSRFFYSKNHCYVLKKSTDSLKTARETRVRWYASVRCFMQKNIIFIYCFHTSTFQLLDKPWSQVSSVLPPGSCLQFFSRIGFKQSHCSSIVHRVLLTHALAFSASQFVHKYYMHP